jgi:hypothetical protein
MPTRTRKPESNSDTSTIKTTILLEPELLAWSKTQPGGLSGLVRRLLREAQEKEGGGRVTALLSEQNLSKIWDTPEEDEAWRDL